MIAETKGLVAPAFRLGDTEVLGRLVLAPMSGYNDQPFRRLCRRFGASLVYTGLISSNAIVYGRRAHGNARTEHMLQFHPEERPVVCQLFGSVDSMIIEAAQQVEGLGVAAIDINLGCPTPKVAGSGAGASMLRDVGSIARLFAGLTRTLSVPVSGKIRLGLDDDSRNYLDAARAIADNGAALIAVHGRTAMQAYRGSADWQAIAEVRRAVDIPVLASGDVKEPGDVERILAATGCDGVMIGRAAIGNPWIFQGFGRGEIPWTERALVVQEHLQMMLAFHGAHQGVRRFRKHLREYLASSGISRRERARLLACDDPEELREGLLGGGIR